MREICTCERPVRAAICTCTRSSSKRSRRTSRACESRIGRSPSSVARASACSTPADWDASSIVSSLQRARPPALTGAQRLGDSLRSLAQVRGQLDGGRLGSQHQAQRLPRTLHAERELRQLARWPHEPRRVAEVPQDLAADGRHGKGREHQSAVRIPTVDGLDEAERGDLDRGRPSARATSGSAGRGCGPAGGSARSGARVRPDRPRGIAASAACRLRPGGLAVGGMPTTVKGGPIARPTRNPDQQIGIRFRPLRR